MKAVSEFLTTDERTTLAKEVNRAIKRGASPKEIAERACISLGRLNYVRASKARLTPNEAKAITAVVLGTPAENPRVVNGPVELVGVHPEVAKDFLKKITMTYERPTYVTAALHVLEAVYMTADRQLLRKAIEMLSGEETKSWIGSVTTDDPKATAP